MWKKIVDIAKKHQEILLYILFGVLTTLVNLAAFGVFNYILGKELYLVNNAIAWIIAVIFAYITNKLFVFKSKSFAAKVFLKEFAGFLGARIFSFVIEEAGMWLLVDVLKLGAYSIPVEFAGVVITGQFLSKVLISVIVVIVNYFFSKLWIFAKK